MRRREALGFKALGTLGDELEEQTSESGKEYFDKAAGEQSQ
jgi:hypothetical protein